MATIHAVKALNKLFQDPVVNSIFACVVEDIVSKTLDYNKTADAFKGIHIAGYRNVLVKIRTTLQTISYIREEISRLWWWDNIYKVERLVLIAMCLERANWLALRTANPTPSNLPSYIAVLTEYIAGLYGFGFKTEMEMHLRLYEFHTKLQIYTHGSALEKTSTR